MRFSEMFFETLREPPQEAELISHKLMLRAALIQKLSSGVYSFLPLGFRVLNNVINIIREEMVRAGAQEVLLPALTPAGLWQESGRWELYGKEMIRIEDRQGRTFALGPTHEEIITDMVRRIVKSYKQLPINLFQIQMKFRDEIRPRFGVMRAKEFLMKDAYSFDADEAGAKKSYDIMYETYTRIFKRIGFDFAVVEADTGAIGGSMSHEFMAIADSGEENLLYCAKCGYAANQEKAEFAVPPLNSDEELLPLQKTETKEQKTVAEVSAFLGVPPEKIVKTLLYKADGKFVAVLIPGSRTVNEIKLANSLNARALTLLSEHEILEKTGSVRGFAGPIGLRGGFEIIADNTIKNMRNFVVGANEKDIHFINANFSRDFDVSFFADIANAVKGDGCPKCGEPMDVRKGIEVGHVFYLGDKYSKPLKATFYDKDGKEKEMVMGCYGIGVSRIIAAAIEQNNDENGIIWPINIAPFKAHIVIVDMKNEEMQSAANALYSELSSLGIETSIDDRAVSPGIKFKDADLIGIPFQIILGKRFKTDGQAEIRRRADKHSEFADQNKVAGIIQEWLKK